MLLKFEKSSEIDAVHIGNEGSAFVEILVGKLGEDVRDFQVSLFLKFVLLKKNNVCNSYQLT